MSATRALWLSEAMTGLLLAGAWLLVSHPVVWNIQAAVFPIWIGTTAVLFYWINIHRPTRNPYSRVAARFRLRTPAVSVAWVAFAVPFMFLAALGVEGLSEAATGAARPAGDYTRLTPYLDSHLGRISFLFLVGVFGPVIEEFFFRGWIQRGLERRFGGVAAVIATALIFAFVHFKPGPYFIGPLFAGIVLGAAVVLTRSIWPSVIMHITWNGGILALGSSFELLKNHLSRPTWTPSLLLALTGALGLTWAGWRVAAMRR